MRGACCCIYTITKLTGACVPKEPQPHTGTSPGLENAALPLSVRLSERQKEEALKYLIHDSAKALSPGMESLKAPATAHPLRVSPNGALASRLQAAQETSFFSFFGF